MDDPTNLEIFAMLQKSKLAAPIEIAPESFEPVGRECVVSGWGRMQWEGPVSQKQLISIINSYCMALGVFSSYSGLCIISPLLGELNSTTIVSKYCI